MRLPTSLAARIGAVVATTAIAVGGATAVASASAGSPNAAEAAAIHRIPTHLRIGNTKPVARAHQTTAVVGGHLVAGRYDLRHMWVVLQRLGRYGRWNRVHASLTRVHGYVFFLVHIGSRPATFRLVFRGTPNFGPAVSRIDTISPARS